MAKVYCCCRAQLMFGLLVIEMKGCRPRRSGSEERLDSRLISCVGTQFALQGAVDRLMVQRGRR